MAHTPGPWRAIAGELFDLDAHTKIAAIQVDPWYVVTDRCETTEPERAENARLIAAAPDLLEAAIVTLRGYERIKEECPREWARMKERAEHATEDLGQGAWDLRVAIAKAAE